MKKIIALVLAVMMLFGTLAVGASALNTEQFFGGQKPLANRADQVVIAFNFNGGTNAGYLPVYDTSIADFVTKNPGEVTGTYLMIPQDKDELKVTYTISLPSVTAPDGRKFDGWQRTDKYDGLILGSTSMYQIPADAAGTIIEFTAAYSPAEVEPDTLSTVLGILIKVFGAIIGIILYSGDTEAGVAMMEKVLGGLF